MAEPHDGVENGDNQSGEKGKGAIWTYYCYLGSCNGRKTSVKDVFHREHVRLIHNIVSPYDEEKYTRCAKCKKLVYTANDNKRYIREREHFLDGSDMCANDTTEWVSQDDPRLQEKAFQRDTFCLLKMNLGRPSLWVKRRINPAPSQAESEEEVSGVLYQPPQPATLAAHSDPNGDSLTGGSAPPASTFTGHGWNHSGSFTPTAPPVPMPQNGADARGPELKMFGGGQQYSLTQDDFPNAAANHAMPQHSNGMFYNNGFGGYRVGGFESRGTGPAPPVSQHHHATVPGVPQSAPAVQRPQFFSGGVAEGQGYGTFDQNLCTAHIDVDWELLIAQYSSGPPPSAQMTQPNFIQAAPDPETQMTFNSSFEIQNWGNGFDPSYMNGASLPTAQNMQPQGMAELDFSDFGPPSQDAEWPADNLPLGVADENVHVPQSPPPQMEGAVWPHLPRAGEALNMPSVLPPVTADETSGTITLRDQVYDLPAWDESQGFRQNCLCCGQIS